MRHVRLTKTPAKTCDGRTMPTSFESYMASLPTRWTSTLCNCNLSPKTKAEKWTARTLFNSSHHVACKEPRQRSTCL